MSRFAIVAATASLGGLLFGYDEGVISGALLFLRKTFHLDPAMQGAVVALALAGATIGAAYAGWFADRHGRRRVIIATACIFVLGSLLCALGMSVPVLLAGRFVVGLGIGIASMLTPLYLGEIAPAEHRGAVVSLNQMCITLGIVLSYGVDYVFSEIAVRDHDRGERCVHGGDGAGDEGTVAGADRGGFGGVEEGQGLCPWTPLRAEPLKPPT